MIVDNKEIEMNALHLILKPDPPQKSALIDTMIAFNSAKNIVLEEARKTDSYNKYKLSKLFYHQIRNDFLLPSQLAVSAITTVVEDHKKHKTPYKYSDFDSVFFDKRVISFKGLSIASISTTIGRVQVNFTIDNYVLWQETPQQVGSAILKYEEEKQLSLVTVIH